MTAPEPTAAGISEILASIRKDYSKLGARIHTVEHSVTCEFPNATLRVHYPALRDGKATVSDLVDSISHFLTNFALPRSTINDLDGQYGTISTDDFKLKHSQLQQEALRLFKKAQKATNRNGEVGELILYLLNEWILSAPQILAKMSLKTNPEMAVHGSDGVHASYCKKTNRLILYWGESKLYGDPSKAIQSAFESIVQSLSDDAVKHELDLVHRFIDLSGLDAAGRTVFLKFLDPFDALSNERLNVTTCLIGFDFDAYNAIQGKAPAEAAAAFRTAVEAKVSNLAPTIANAMKKAGLTAHSIEFFLFPVPSVQDLRDAFQAKIGWNA